MSLMLTVHTSASSLISRNVRYINLW